MKFKHFLLYSLLFLTVSCNVHLVPTKSNTALSMISQTQKDANAAFSSLDYNESLYLVAEVDASNLIAFDKTRVKAGVIPKQDAIILKKITEYAAEHKTAATIVNSTSNSYKTYFKSVIDPRIVSENTLK